MLCLFDANNCGCAVLVLVTTSPVVDIDEHGYSDQGTSGNIIDINMSPFHCSSSSSSSWNNILTTLGFKNVGKCSLSSYQ